MKTFTHFWVILNVWTAKAASMDFSFNEQVYGVYSLGLVECDREALWEKAGSIFEEMFDKNLKPPPRLWNIYLGTLGRTQQWRKALEVRNSMKDRDVDGDRNTHLLTIKILSTIPILQNSDVWKRALNVLETMTSKNIDPDITFYVNLIHVLRQYNRNFEISEISKDLTETYMNSIRQLGPPGPAGFPAQRATEILYQLAERMVKPSIKMVNGAVILCGRSYMWLRALDIIENMRSQEVKGNQITFNAALAATRRGVRWEVAERLTKMMKEDSVKPNLMTYNIAMAIVRESAPYDPLEAPDAISNMPGVVDLVARYSQAFSFTVDKHKATPTFPKWKKAIQLMRRAQKLGLALSPPMYETLAEEYIKDKQWEALLKLLSTMHRRELFVSDELYDMTLETLRDDKQWERAIAVFESMHEKSIEPGFHTDAIMIDMLAKINRFDMITALFKKKLLTTFSIKLPNGRYNVFAIEEADKENENDINWPAERPLERISRSMYRIGPLRLSIVGLNLPGNVDEVIDLKYPRPRHYNDSYDHGVCIQRAMSGRRVLGLHNETELFQAMRQCGIEYLRSKNSSYDPNYWDRQDIEKEKERQAVKRTANRVLRNPRSMLHGSSVLMQDDDRHGFSDEGAVENKLPEAEIRGHSDIEDFAEGIVAQDTEDAEDDAQAQNSNAWDQAPMLGQVDYARWYDTV